MNLSTFLSEIKNKNDWNQKPALIFVGKTYPFLFLNNTLKFLSKKNLLPASYKNLSLDSTEKIKLTGSLQQSFLGEKSFYWLGEYKIGKTEKTKTDLLNLLLNYKGPNFIALHITNEKASTKISSLFKKIDHVKIEDEVNLEKFKEILNFFEINFNEKKLALVKNIFNQVNQIPLDTTYMFIKYLDLISSKIPNKFHEYLTTLTLQEQPSLTNLSQYFFTKNREAFFYLWSQVYCNYSEMFWIAFWSEQIWKAYFVTKLIKQKNYSAARSLSFRLPYSFIKKDWQHVCLNTLEKSYSFLYNNDYKFKRGCNFCFLDLFYLNYFENKFY